MATATATATTVTISKQYRGYFLIRNFSLNVDLKTKNPQVRL
jgi:hypothetical protein